jgi:hypothetical protein
MIFIDINTLFGLDYSSQFVYLDLTWDDSAWIGGVKATIETLRLGNNVAHNSFNPDVRCPAFGW